MKKSLILKAALQILIIICYSFAVYGGDLVYDDNGQANLIASAHQGGDGEYDCSSGCMVNGVKIIGKVLVIGSEMSCTDCQYGGAEVKGTFKMDAAGNIAGVDGSVSGTLLVGDVEVSGDIACKGTGKGVKCTRVNGRVGGIDMNGVSTLDYSSPPQMVGNCEKGTECTVHGIAFKKGGCFETDDKITKFKVTCGGEATVGSLFRGEIEITGSGSGPVSLPEGIKLFTGKATVNPDRSVTFKAGSIFQIPGANERDSPIRVRLGQATTYYPSDFQGEITAKSYILPKTTPKGKVLAIAGDGVTRLDLPVYGQNRPASGYIIAIDSRNIPIEMNEYLFERGIEGWDKIPFSKIDPKTKRDYAMIVSTVTCDSKSCDMDKSGGKSFPNTPFLYSNAAGEIWGLNDKGEVAYLSQTPNECKEGQGMTGSAIADITGGSILLAIVCVVAVLSIIGAVTYKLDQASKRKEVIKRFGQNQQRLSTFNPKRIDFSQYHGTDYQVDSQDTREAYGTVRLPNGQLGVVVRTYYGDEAGVYSTHYFVVGSDNNPVYLGDSTTDLSSDDINSLMREKYGEQNAEGKEYAATFQRVGESAALLESYPEDDLIRCLNKEYCTQHADDCRPFLGKYYLGNTESATGQLLNGASACVDYSSY